VDYPEDYEPPQFGEPGEPVMLKYLRKYKSAVQALVIIRDTHPGTQEVEWYRDVATRALEQIQEIG
jgi:hypothetical protein